MREIILKRYYDHLYRLISNMKAIKERLSRPDDYKEWENIDHKKEFDYEIRLYKVYHAEYQYLIQNLLPEEKIMDGIIRRHSLVLTTVISGGVFINIEEGDILKYTQHSDYNLEDMIFLVVWIKQLGCLGYYKAGDNIPHPFTEHDEPHQDVFAHCDYLGNWFQNEELHSMFNFK